MQSDGPEKGPSQECVWPVQEVGGAEGRLMVVVGWEE